MNAWTIVVLVWGAGCVLNRVSSTTDEPVSRRLAAAREVLERGPVLPSDPAPQRPQPGPRSLAHVQLRRPGRRSAS